MTKVVLNALHPLNSCNATISQRIDTRVKLTAGCPHIFTLYDKDTLIDLNEQQKKVLKQLLQAEIEARKKS